MHGLLSPQFSNSGRHDLFTKQRSPSYRNKRIPSAQEHMLCASNQNLKTSKQESPSKFSQEIKRRKSHYVDSNHLSNSGNKKKGKGQVIQEQNVQEIINSIQNLKSEYHNLKQAYQQLIKERMTSSEDMKALKRQNDELRNQIGKQQKQKQEYAIKVDSLQQQLEISKKQIELERAKNRKLQNDLYFLTEKQKSKTQNLHLNNIKLGFDQILEKDQFEDPRDALEDISHKNNNQSQLLSFSLSSVLQQSLKIEQLHRRRKQHVKVVSDLSHTSGLKNDYTTSQTKPKKEALSNFKKNKKQKHDNIQSKQSKAISGNPLNQLLNLKSPASADKKSLKNLGIGPSTTKRRKAEEKENIDARNGKKKSKKLMLINQ